MNLDPRNWGINQKLAAVALTLGGLALVGSPSPGGAVTLDTEELAHIVESEVDHVTAEELAEWVIEGRVDYRLLDVRDPAAYAEYHIPTAESVTLRELHDYPLYKNEKIVLYSDGGIHSAQAWFLLRARGFSGAYILLGGLDLWMDDVLFPALPQDATEEEREAFARRQAVSRAFGGKPRTDVDESEPAEIVLPKVAPAASSPVPQRRKRPNKEGC
jgi:rhodanese-related sulfurtransferase